MCVFLSSFCVVLSSLLFPLCVFVCYVSVSIGSVCLCSLLCLLGVPPVFCVCSTVCLCVIPFSLCVLFMCVCCVCLICVACICYWSVYLCVCVSYMYVCVLFLRVLCLCVYCVCVPLYVYYVCLTCVPVPVSVSYVYCICYVYVCFSVVCLCCWLPCWCGVYHGGVMGACFLGLVVLVFWGVWRVWNFFIFYSRFGVGGRLLLGFCYRTFFCGFPWGLCHARNFFKDITHSYCGYVIPVMSLYMPLLAHLYHTRYCADTIPVPFSVTCIVPAFHSMLPRYCVYSYTLSCVYLCLHYVP